MFWVGILWCWGYKRKVGEDSAVFAAQNKGCVQGLREGPCPEAPAVSGTVPVGPAWLRAQLSASAGAVVGEKQCGTEGHSVACHLPWPHRAHLWVMLRPGLCCVPNREVPGTLPGLWARGEWGVRIIGKNKQLYIKYKRAIPGWITF